MRRLLAPFLAGLFTLASACSPSTPAGPKAAPAAAPPPAPPGAPAGPAAPDDPFAVKGPLASEPAVAVDDSGRAPAPMPLSPPPPGVAPPPAACQAFARRRPAKAPACRERAEAIAALDAALGQRDAHQRDAALLALAACEGLPAGMATALRAEYAPAGCADVVVGPVLAAAPGALGAAMQQTLFAHGVAARLARTVGAAPKLAPPYDKKRVLEHLSGPLKAWMTEQAAAVQALSELGASLSFYARGVVALEAALADMRFVGVVRGAPVPEEFKRDAELRDAYYGALDQALEPRKARGRDAALVGLRDFARVGALADGRLERARALLSELYGGKRVDALDPLILPPLAPPAASSAEERLAAALPTYYAGLLFAGREPSPPFVRALLERGLPWTVRAKLSPSAELAPELRRLALFGRLALGRRYRRAVDFDEAAAQGARLPAVSPPDEVRLAFALALALRGGPEDVAALMRNAPADVAGGDVRALDAVAAAGGPFAGAAAFDAARVREAYAPAGADAGYWRDVAARYRKSAAALSDARQRAAAEERAAAADAIAVASVRP
ncbi:MAG TPA: hypothetical protein VFS43_13470 [Polyangiaceae bacterium]|nr:hypothetical protein [Polyangiaceae bacterium]